MQPSTRAPLASRVPVARRQLPPGGVTVVVSHDPGPCITVSGELDVATAPLLRAVLEHVQRRTSRRVEVDLRDVRFADSHGLEPVVAAGVAVRAASAPVRRVLAASDAAAPGLLTTVER